MKVKFSSDKIKKSGVYIFKLKDQFSIEQVYYCDKQWFSCDYPSFKVTEPFINDGSIKWARLI